MKATSLTLSFLIGLSCIGMAAPLSDWFAKPNHERGDIPAKALQTELGNAEAINKAKLDVWKAYKAGAIQQGWDKAITPSKLSDLQTWLKARRIDSKMAELGEKKMPYVVFAKGKKPATGWPLFICLHGGGGNARAQGPHSWGVNSREWVAQMRLTSGTWDSPGLYVIPRMADDREGRWYYDYNQIFIDRVIQQAILFNQVDPNHVYLMGISEGGYAAFRLGSLMADRWAGSCAMAAAEPIGNAPPENFRHVAFRCGIGERDSMFNRIGLARTYFKRLEELKKAHPGNYTHFFDEQKGRGHGINYKPGPAWIAQFKRTAVPKTVTWTVIKQHKLHRHRMYWLALDGYKGQLPLKLTAEAKAENLIEINAKPGKEGETLDNSGLGLRVYLNDDLVDFSKEVTIKLNGKEAFKGMVKPNMEAIIRSTAERGDPKQVFPAQVKIKL